MATFKSFSIPIIIAVCLFAPKAQAAGIQVSPALVEFSVPENVGEKTVQITVANPTADVQILEVYVDDFAESFSIKPASFTLESGARKTVAIALLKNKLPSQANLGLAGTISVVGKPLAEGRVNVGTGIKLPFTITLLGAQNPQPAHWPNWLWAIIGGAGISLLWGFGLFAKKHIKKAI